MESILFTGACARSLLLSLTLVLPGFALAQGASSTPLKATGQDGGFRARLQAAARLYEELEYEQALKALAQAKSLAKTDNERVQVALYEGIVLADLGQRPRSLRAFREALTLELDVRLPVKVSPKVERDFETVRKEVRNEREVIARAKPLPAPRQRPSVEAPPATTDRPVQSPSVVVTPTPLPPVSSPADVGLDQPMPDVERARGIRPLPLALLGAGVVAGGVGSYFGLQSRGDIDDARANISVGERSNHLEEARGKALAANILFGVAITAAAGAAITWLTGNDTGSTAEVSP
ncbi:tetratricopeptide repeat protein [Pyxidicoccus xibeiensis]|uniref:tetratricopeptide repeat protein n=1 Tax=Pyxidicoccus xibeiensis TaxID=2906759 RepID=UPI0020A7B49B|nr:tetratricopeptide repeat protein [Pyxidicoccus xibeiensis]MCP3141303.1 tetratricopeptide repeat protein [Pyxidicoccus xibeiensis]